jgi:hypothetical protein
VTLTRATLYCAVLCCDVHGVQESVFPDGVVVREFPGGRKEVVKPP